MIKKLKKILDNIEYAKSEVSSAMDSVPEYECNSAGKEFISQAESYLFDAEWDLKEVVAQLGLMIEELENG